MGGPTIVVTAYRLLSRPFARSQSADGTIRGNSERAPVIERMLVKELTVTMGKSVAGVRFPVTESATMAPSARAATV